MARYMLVLTFLMMSFLAFVQNGQAQNTPDARRQLNQDIQNQQRQIQERSREIEQRVQDQQREEERYRREQEERRRREEWIEQQRQSGTGGMDLDDRGGIQQWVEGQVDLLQKRCEEEDGRQSGVPLTDGAAG